MVLAFGAMSAEAQNVTVVSATGENIEAFVKQNFIGDGVQVFNVRFNNASGSIVKPQIGTFQANGFTGVMMDSGIVLTTGHVSVAEGPNNHGSMHQEVTGYYTDPLMDAVSTGTLKACATLDFDFVCLSNHVSFTYCFGSEEYPEYVGSNYNDVFAFFLTGPDPATGLSTTRNIALVPESITDSTPDGIAVAINSINSGTPGVYGYSYIDIHPENSHYYRENPQGTTGLQYNGYTQKLTAEATLVPCEIYHMHISICNVTDNNRDSGVLLEGHSLHSSSVHTPFTRNGVTTLHRSTEHDEVLTLAGTGYSTGRVHLQFGGDLTNGVDFLCIDEHGMLINDSNDSFIVNDDPHFFTLVGTDSANLTIPKHITVYLATELCPQFPQLQVYDSLQFLMVEDEPIGIEEIKNSKKGIGLYPNPANARVTITSEDWMEKIEVVDASGHVVVHKPATGYKAHVDLEGLDTGVYTVRVITTNSLYTKILVVK